jgi:16S rRNA (cytidine(1402)-2'-O)-methyltransferase
MLRAYGIDKSSGQLLAVHQHNETEAAHTVIAHLRQGQRVAYVSDAGTPGISDPGARLAAALVQEGLRCIPLPGASSVTTLLSVAGIGAESGVAGGFVFQGFLSSKSTERTNAVQKLAQEARAVLLLEAPHRIEALAEALTLLGTRQLTIGRELTKQFEEIATCAAQDFAAWLQADPIGCAASLPCCCIRRQSPPRGRHCAHSVLATSRIAPENSGEASRRHYRPAAQCTVCASAGTQNTFPGGVRDAQDGEEKT